MIEEFIDDGSGAAPDDYKLYVFDGAVKLIQVSRGRFTHHRVRLYSPDWRRFDVLFEFDDIIGDVPPPVHLDEMISAAQILGKEFDFIRIDLYDTPERLYLGELTVTPFRGLHRFRPKEFDDYLGGHWNLHTR
jgi:hypothetical protein